MLEAEIVVGVLCRNGGKPKRRVTLGSLTRDGFSKRLVAQRGICGFKGGGS